MSLNHSSINKTFEILVPFPYDPLGPSSRVSEVIAIDGLIDHCMLALFPVEHASPMPCEESKLHQQISNRGRLGTPGPSVREATGRELHVGRIIRSFRSVCYRWDLQTRFVFECSILTNSASHTQIQVAGLENQFIQIADIVRFAI